jgi:hypothetical protein
VGDTERTTLVTQVISGRCLGRKRVHCECADNKRPVSFPHDSGRKTFKRLPTKTEWARFRKYGRRMRELTSLRTETVSLEVLSAIRLRTANEPLLPNLKTLFLWGIGELFIQYVPWFISPGTTSILLEFFESELPKATIASMVTTLPILCPNLQAVTLHSLPRDPMITTAVSGMLLDTNQNTLQKFKVDSPLTEEARGVIYKLPNLCGLSVVIERGMSLPPALLPDLTDLTIICDDEGDWPQLFHGATFGKLKSVTFYPQSNQIGDFLGAFERAALSSSVQNTLKAFELSASCSWNPNYSSFLPFTWMEHLDIEYPCDDGCSSRVDDDIIVDLSQAMPNLRSLKLGDDPCPQFTTGVTSKGLMALARHCPNLFMLRIHFQVASLSTPPASLGTTPNIKSTPSRKDCALTDLLVGDIPVPEESALMVALALLRIFPHVSYLYYTDEGWEKVEDAIYNSKRIVDCSCKQCPPLHLEVPSITPLQEPQLRLVVDLGVG